MLSHTEADTKKIAAEFAQTLQGGDVVFLYGDLGAGKTTFVRGVAAALGFHDPVRSPTFTLVNRYPISHPSIREIIHVDLYRLKSPDELRALALEEDLGRQDMVAFVEWPEHAQGALGSPTHEITFTIEGSHCAITLPPRQPATPRPHSSARPAPSTRHPAAS